MHTQNGKWTIVPFNSTHSSQRFFHIHALVVVTPDHQEWQHTHNDGNMGISIFEMLTQGEPLIL